MRKASGDVGKQNDWFNVVQKKVSEFLHKFSCAQADMAPMEQSELDRLSSLQTRYSKQHNKDMTALERRQRKTMEQSAARIKAMKLAKSHFHVEQSGENWQVYNSSINPISK